MKTYGRFAQVTDVPCRRGSGKDLKWWRTAGKMKGSGQEFWPEKKEYSGIMPSPPRQFYDHFLKMTATAPVKSVPAQAVRPLPLVTYFDGDENVKFILNGLQRYRRIPFEGTQQ